MKKDLMKEFHLKKNFFCYCRILWFEYVFYSDSFTQILDSFFILKSNCIIQGILFQSNRPYNIFTCLLSNPVNITTGFDLGLDPEWLDSTLERLALYNNKILKL